MTDEDSSWPTASELNHAQELAKGLAVQGAAAMWLVEEFIPKAIAALQVMANDPKPEAGECKIPLPGWRCTRKPGHPGPCAVLPLERPVPVSAREWCKARDVHNKINNVIKGRVGNWFAEADAIDACVAEEMEAFLASQAKLAAPAPTGAKEFYFNVWLPEWRKRNPYPSGLAGGDAINFAEAYVASQVIGSMTYGDLVRKAPRVAEHIEPHEWDNKNPSEQRDFLLQWMEVLQRELANRIHSELDASERARQAEAKLREP